jgi:NAD(P)H-hydrate epimerase
MREWERATWASGQTEAEVIRRVGQCVARTAMRLTQGRDLVLLLAGKGHNGDDVRAAREHLVERCVELLEVNEPASDIRRLEDLLKLRPALIIDGLFGIGLNRMLSADWAKFIECVNESVVPVLAVDVPSGLNAETGQPEGAAIHATMTLTVGAPKAGTLLESAWPYVGRLEVAPDVGLVSCPVRSGVEWTLPEDFIGFPPTRPVATHKGSYGHVAIIAGSVGYHGAAVLSARGAQRAQPGLVTLYVLEKIYTAVASQLRAVMVSPWQPGLELPDTVSAVVAGPGLAGEDVPEELKLWVRQTWRGAPMAMVVDASALSWLRSEPVPGRAVRAITPHPGEAARLLGITSNQVQANRFLATRKLSQNLGNSLVVLKGHQTLVGRATGDLSVNPSGNPHLAQGGSGDVLSGYVGGLLAQPELQLNPLKALRYAVWKHGAAADRLQAARRSWVVEDLVEEL